jgi:cytochrome c-type biogenesis protein
LSLAQIATSFTFGILASGNPCALPLYPGFVAYLASRSNLINSRRTEAYVGLLVIIGLLTSMLVFGAIATMLQISFLRFLSSLNPIVNGILLILWVVLALNLKVSTRMPGFGSIRIGHPYLEAVVYGFIYGPITLPCNLPLVLSIVAFSLTVVDALSRLLVFVLFGIGLGFPLIILSLAARAKRRAIIHALVKRHEIMTRIAGVLLILIALYGLIYIPAYLSGLLG